MIEEIEANRLLVCNELAKGTDPDEIAALLVQKLARDYAQNVIHREQSRKSVQEFQERNRQYHIFGVRKDSATTLRPTYSAYKVQQAGIQAFAKVHKVSVDDLMKISRGDVEEVKGIRQANHVGPLDRSRRNRLVEEWKATRREGNQSSLPADGPFYGAKPGETERPSGPIFDSVVVEFLP